jgi:hypothetical protein
MVISQESNIICSPSFKPWNHPGRKCIKPHWLYHLSSSSTVCYYLSEGIECWSFRLLGDKWEGWTYRAWAGVPPNFRWLFASWGGLKVNASIVLRMYPFYLISRFLKWVKSALCPLNPDFFILRNCVQVFDHWVHSLAVPCRHLCDTYLENKRN